MSFVRIGEDAEDAALLCADWMANEIQRALFTQDRFSIVLAGGTTPKILYEQLASGNYNKKIDWTKLHIFFGDERYVPFSDERNNARMATEVMLNKVPIPAEQIHIMQTDVPPQEAAENYERKLKQYFGNNKETFDLVLLGMGDDAHTLSIFPNSPLVHNTTQWVTHTWLESQQMHRITLLPKPVNMAKRVAFLVTGKTKQFALRNVRNSIPNPNLYPAQLIQPYNKQLYWFLDDAIM